MISRAMLAGLLCLCWEASAHSPDTASSASDQHTIYVASLGWHSALVVPRTAIPDSLWPEHCNFAESPYLEIGWGDRDYYQHRNFNPWYLLKASLWPTRSILHINTAPADIPRHYVAEAVVQLRINDEELQNLSHYILSHMTTNAHGELIHIREGFYPGSHFFAGSSKYYLPKNSNVWTAAALKHAGFSLVPAFLQTTGQVIKKAERFGKVIVEP